MERALSLLHDPSFVTRHPPLATRHSPPIAHHSSSSASLPGINTPLGLPNTGGRYRKSDPSASSAALFFLLSRSSQPSPVFCLKKARKRAKASSKKLASGHRMCLSDAPTRVNRVPTVYRWGRALDSYS